ncbi:ParB/RepB/Spo0J family partition protein [Vibrio aestuarianus]|uniref:ParB/RepB/Spo0J family partition protein n=1 Tax=Vibrio aestuarianus TaxID=28171 RepID=UPI00237C7277|nr:ParB/RepB/Spo0J family partition protein [Vibrio aestuarianus]MDE1315469.1 ParB/RepB/Spo0J family partition protein [Vibrio aestuarianus]
MSGFVLKAAETAKSTISNQQNSPKPQKQDFKIEVEDEILLIPWQIIHPDPDQPRKERDPIEFLKVSNSIKQTKGNTQPVSIRKHPSIKGEYMLIAGEGRWTACKEHDLKVRSILKQDFDNELLEPEQAWNKLFYQVSENVGRNDLTLVREAEALDLLVKSHKDELPAKDIGLMLGYDKTKTSRLMKLASAPDSIKQLSLDGVSQNINMFILLIDLFSLVDESTFSEYLSQVKDKQLFERGLREIVRNLKSPKKTLTSSDNAIETLLNKALKKRKLNDSINAERMSEMTESVTYPLVVEALSSKKCSEKLAATIQSNLERAKDEGYEINEEAISEHLQSMTPTSLKSFSDFDTIVDECVAVYEKSSSQHPAAPQEVSKFPEMESFEIVDGYLLIYVKDQKLPLKIDKKDAKSLKTAIEQM